MNSWNFTGNIGKDCETRFIPSGDAVVNFTVAATSGYGDKAVTTWVNCNMWGKRGEAVAPYLKRGQQVAVTGELTNRPYTDKDGNQKYSLEVRVNDLTLTGAKGGNDQSDARQPAQSKPESNGQKAHSGFDDFDEIPF